ncbi:ORC1-type DNA replication protein [Candidatus Aenigmatarchaeota archaeon]
MKIRDMLLSDESLFRNEEIFNPDHIPEEFSYRDNQLRALANCAKPALRGGRPASAFLYGKPATGKTTSVRLVIDEIEKSSDRVVCVHINSQIYSTAYKIFSEIHKKIFGYLPADTGIPLTRIYDKIFTRLGKHKKNLIVVLDDVNFLFLNSSANDVFYQILRAHEVHPVHTAVWTISTTNDNHRLDDKVRSMFRYETIRYEPYNPKEIFSILKNRVELGLCSEVMSQALIRKITAEAQDLRHGIELIRKSVLLAERDAKKRISGDHVKDVIEQLKPSEIKKQKLSKDDKLVLDLLKKGEQESGKLFELVIKRKKIGYTTFHRTLKKLESMKRIKVEERRKKRGKTSAISLI